MTTTSVAAAAAAAIAQVHTTVGGVAKRVVRRTKTAMSRLATTFSDVVRRSRQCSLCRSSGSKPRRRRIVLRPNAVNGRRMLWLPHAPRLKCAVQVRALRVA